MRADGLPYQHIGNMRAYVFADTLSGLLRWKGYAVRHVINITDVGHLLADADQGDDKVERASGASGRPIWEIAGHYTAVFLDDLAALNVGPPDEWPKATDVHPADDRLRGGARVARAMPTVLPDGLYFDTAREPTTASWPGSTPRRRGRRAARRDGRGQTHAGRLRTLAHVPDDERRPMQWDSPWGVGAPGWHLECSVMSIGPARVALRHPHRRRRPSRLHHANEIAQSEAYLDDGRAMGALLVHGEFVNLKDRKMAKSAGGTILLSDLVDHGVHPEAYRYLLLQSHYASQIEFSEAAAPAAHVTLKRLALRLRGRSGLTPAGRHWSSP